MIGYCVSCKGKREMKRGHKSTKLDNGVTLHKGLCSKCGSKMSVFGK
jgi:hypothetical protein